MMKNYTGETKGGQVEAFLDNRIRVCFTYLYSVLLS